MSSEKRLQALERMLQAEPDDVFLNYALALEYLRDPSAITLAGLQLKKVLSLDTDYIAAYYQLGKLSESAGKMQEALEFYNKGLAVAEKKKDNKSAGEFREAIFMLED